MHSGFQAHALDRLLLLHSIWHNFIRLAEVELRYTTTFIFACMVVTTRRRRVARSNRSIRVTQLAAIRCGLRVARAVRAGKHRVERLRGQLEEVVVVYNQDAAVFAANDVLPLDPLLT